MKRILILEDDDSIAELERDYLEIAGFEAVIIANGREGLQRGLEGGFDLVLLDVMLPEMDGFEICRALRRETQIPILMVTARKEDIDKIRGLGLGADDYIVKPFSPSELVARVNAHLARYERLPSLGERRLEQDGICYKGLKIQPAARRVFVREQEIPLTNRGFELLLFLAQNPNIVFSKETLLERIWGFDSLGDASTVTVHINRIREKIEEDSSRPQYIETVWGAGYRFKME